MSETPDAQKVTRWIESELGARVLRVTRQPRWRPVWFVETERGGEPQTFVVRGERLDARIGFTLQQEMTLQRLLHEVGIPVAAVHGWVDDPRAYVMDFVVGEEHFGNTRPAERDAVMDQYMETLAKIHTLDVAPFADAGILRAPQPAEAGRIGMQVYERAYRAVKEAPGSIFWSSHSGGSGATPAPAPRRESVVLWDTGQLLHGEGQLRALIESRDRSCRRPDDGSGGFSHAGCGVGDR